MKRPLARSAGLILVLAGLATSSCGPALSPTPEPTDTLTPTAQPPPTHTAMPEPTATEPSTATTVPPTPTPRPLILTSPAFANEGMIPKKYTRRSEDLSPPLQWSDPPEGTQSFALLFYSDPVKDGGGNWVQWILYNIPPQTRALPEGLTPDAQGLLPDGSRHFANSWEELKYGGPNPPHVYTYKFYFVLYALDSILDLDAVEKTMAEEGTLPWIGSSMAVLSHAVDGHILAQGELVGKYKED